MDIVNVAKEHYLTLIDIWEKAVRATHTFLPERNIEELKPLILQHYFDAVELRGAVDNDNLVGFIGVVDANIEMLFVTPEVFGCGVGRSLVEYAFENLNAEKVDVNEQNPRAIGFYEKMGFEKVGRSELDGQGNPFPLIHMARR